MKLKKVLISLFGITIFSMPTLAIVACKNNSDSNTLTDLRRLVTLGKPAITWVDNFDPTLVSAKQVTDGLTEVVTTQVRALGGLGVTAEVMFDFKITIQQGGGALTGPFDFTLPIATPRTFMITITAEPFSRKVEGNSPLIEITLPQYPFKASLTQLTISNPGAQEAKKYITASPYNQVPGLQTYAFFDALTNEAVNNLNRVSNAVKFKDYKYILESNNNIIDLNGHIDYNIIGGRAFTITIEAVRTSQILGGISQFLTVRVPRLSP